MSPLARRIAVSVVLLTALAVWQLTSRAQTNETRPALQPPKAGTRFHFEIVESFDAKYEGDTPGHTGRGGGLGDARPNVALGDPVFRGDKKIGTITSALWSRVQGSLVVEFDPEPELRIAVGDTVWVDLNPLTGK